MCHNHKISYKLYKKRLNAEIFLYDAGEMRYAYPPTHMACVKQCRRVMWVLSPTKTCPALPIDGESVDFGSGIIFHLGYATLWWEPKVKGLPSLDWRTDLPRPCAVFFRTIEETRSLPTVCHPFPSS